MVDTQRRHALVKVAALSVLFGMASGCASREIDIRFVNARAGETAIKPPGGWPLVLNMTAHQNKLKGIDRESLELLFPGSEDLKLLFPGSEETGYLVFGEAYIHAEDDPDEARVEFKAGVNSARPLDCDDRRRILTFDEDSGSNRRRSQIGPCTSSEEGFGFGANRRLPGLIVVADAGPGVITDERFERPSPLQAANLAGMFQSVTYELKDARGRTSIQAHMNVPTSLFTPVLLVEWADGSIIARRDGGPVFMPARARELLEDHKVTVRAFVVDEEAPPVLQDLDENGVVDRFDAELMGLRLLSKQAVIRFTQVHGKTRSDLLAFAFDFDGDGEAKVRFPLDRRKPGPGELVDPPR